MAKGDKRLVVMTEDKAVPSGVATLDSVGNVPFSQLGNVVRPNLLDNAYFVNPVNQRGQTEYTGAGYTIDRWINLASNSAVIVQEDSLKMIGTSSGSYCRLNQIFDPELVRFLAGQKATFSVLVKGYYRIYLHNATNQTSIMGYKSGYAPDWDVISSTVTVPEGSTYLRMEICNNDKGEGEFKGAALENNPVQTAFRKDADGNWVLNEIPDYGEELRKCQRYYYNSDGVHFILTEVGGAKILYAGLSTPVPMRATPKLTTTNVRFYPGNIAIPGIGWTAYGLRSNNVMIQSTSPVDGATPSTTGHVEMSYTLDADL